MFEFNVFDKYFDNQERVSKTLINDINIYVSEELKNEKKLNKKRAKILKDRIFKYIVNYLEIHKCGISRVELQQILINFNL